MAKRLNKNLVVGLAALGFVVTTVAGVLMVYQLQKTDPAEFERRAEQYAEEADYARASAFFTRAYQASQDPVYLLRAGDMMALRARELDALKLYEQAVIADPTMVDAHDKMLDLRLEIAKVAMLRPEYWRAVQESADRLIELQDPNEKNAKAVYAKGRALLGLKEQDPQNEALGVSLMEEAVKLSPGTVDYAVDLADYYKGANEPEKADSIYENLLQHVGDTGKDAALARCYYARQISSKRDFDRALELLTEAEKIAQAANDSETLALACVTEAQAWVGKAQQVARDAAGKPEQESVRLDPHGEEFANAIKALNRAIEEDPEGFEAYMFLSTVYSRQGDAKKAIEVCDTRLAKPIAREGLEARQAQRWRYALLLQAAELYVNLAAEEQEGSDQRTELAEKASVYIEDALGEIPNGSNAYHLRGRVKLIEGKNLEAIRQLEIAAEKSYGTNWRNSYYLALARMQEGQIGAARDAIEEAVKADWVSSEVWNLFGRILLRMDQPKDAIDAVSQVLARNPRDPQALMIKAAAEEQLDQPDRALQTIDSIDVKAPMFVATKAQALAARGQIDTALELLTGALAENPESFPLVSAAVAIYKSSDEMDKAHAVLDKALAVEPESFELRFLDINLRNLPEDERNSELQKLIQQEPDEYLRAMRMATYYSAVNDKENELEQLGKALDLITSRATESARRAGDSALRSIMERRFVAAAELGSDERLQKIVDDATRLNVDAAEGLSYQGRLLLLRGRNAEADARTADTENRPEEATRLHNESQRLYEEAIAALKQALERYPTNSEALAQLGDAYLLMNRMEEAKIALERANEIVPRNGYILKRLAWISRLLGADDEFLQLLRQCREVIPDDAWVAEQLLIAEEDQQPRKGIERREKIRKDNPEDIDNLLTLARLYREVDDPRSTEQCINQILALSPEQDVVERVATLLQDMGKNEQALKLLEKNLREAPSDQKAEAQLAIARHYQNLRRYDLAEAAYLAAADIDANQQVCMAVARFALATSQDDLARKWIDKALEKARESESPQLASIEAIRVESLLNAGEIEAAQKACDEYTQTYPEDPTGLLLDAQVAARRGSIVEAIDKLSRFLERRTGQPVALYMRAQFFASLGEWERAIADLEAIRANNPTALDMRPRILLARAYDHTGQRNLAFLELEGVNREYPGNSMVVAELLSMYRADGRLVDADNVVTSLLNSSPQNVSWLIHAGEIATEQKDRSKAMASFRQAASLSGYHPEVTTTMLASCQTLNAIEDGINFYESEIPPDRKTPPVMLAYANLLAKRGDIQTAMDTYRAALYRSGFTSYEFIAQTAASLIKAVQRNRAFELCREEDVDELFQRANDHLLAALLQADGQAEEALTRYKALLETCTSDDERATIQLCLGIVYNGIDQFQEARKAYEAALEANPQNLFALNNLAYLLTEDLNQPELAVPYAKRAAELSGEPAILDTLGWAYVCVGEYNNAIAQLTQANQQDSNYLPAAFHLGEAYRRSGQFDEAQSILESVIQQGAGGRYDEYREKAKAALDKVHARDTA